MDTILTLLEKDTRLTPKEIASMLSLSEDEVRSAI